MGDCRRQCREYDRKASNHVAVHHEASASAGRYNKCLLPKAAFAALTATMSKARSSHYEQTLPWDDQGSRLLTVSNYEHYMALLDAVEETVRGAHASTVDWRSLLRRYMTDAAKRDYSWSLPNRRFIDSGLYLPSIRSEGIDTIAVIVDTSGSLPAATLAAFWTVLREIATELQPERVILLQVDAAVQDAAEYAGADLPDEIRVKGRGGTDFRPGFAWLEENGIRPGVCLYLTDMLCSSYPENEPAFDVVWANYAEPPGDWNREPWGERIQIEH